MVKMTTFIIYIFTTILKKLITKKPTEFYTLGEAVWYGNYISLKWFKKLRYKNGVLFKICITNPFYVIVCGKTQILLSLCQTVDSEEMDPECENILGIL